VAFYIAALLVMTLSYLKPYWLFILLVLLISGCSSFGVEPWQREVLSRPEMQFGNNDLNQKFSSHFYFSKEASSGGSGFAGGGCGCN
jgi:hypothetical protein